MITLTIDGKSVSVPDGRTVLDAARQLGLDIPTLCYLEECGPLNSCLACLVKINGKMVPSCGTKATPGMVVESETAEVHEARRTALELLFSEHVGDCLSPCQRLCPLRLNIPVMLRQIQAGQLGAAASTVRETLPLPGVLGRLCHHPCEQGCRRGTWDDPAAIRELERVVADQSASKTDLPARKPATGKSVVIVGSGPAGLAAAYYLLKEGHACTIADRHTEAGGSLRLEVEQGRLPQSVLDAELSYLQRLGAHFKPGVALGVDLSLDGLLLGFDAVLLAIGEVSKTESANLGLELSATGIKAHLETFQTSRASVFAAGRAVRSINQLVRAMSEGQAAAECIHRFLLGQEVQRPEKPFSNVMGRLDQDELELFVRGASTGGSVWACDRCAGFSSQEAASESARCLHCDCRSSGQCSLQSYAQLYRVDANRYRRRRPRFEQYEQKGGIIFEPGKCILCGICVKLTEMAAEPLGLTFVGRGFDVRVAAPFGGEIEEGLQKVAAECVEHCPTGALTFKTNREG